MFYPYWFYYRKPELTLQQTLSREHICTQLNTKLVPDSKHIINA